MTRTAVFHQVIQEQLAQTEKGDFGVHEVHVGSGGRPHTYGISDGPKMPKMPEVSHQTLLNIRNSGLSIEKMGFICQVTIKKQPKSKAYGIGYPRG
jgi:hypothetical protein